MHNFRRNLILSLLGIPGVTLAVLVNIGFSVLPLEAQTVNKYGITCRLFRAKKANVPVYREADRRSEVLGRLSRSQEVCGMAEMKEFVSVVWDPEAPPEAPPKTEVPRAYVRLVDLWHPKSEASSEKNVAKEWWQMRQNGVVPDDPIFWLRPFLSFFGISKQDMPVPQAAPGLTPTPVEKNVESGGPENMNKPKLEGSQI